MSERGEKYARALADFVSDLQLNNCEVWVTQYQRTQQTARHLPGPHLVKPELGEIQAGAHDGLTYEEIAAKLPPFLQVKKNVTGDPAFSMYNLSIRSDWEDSAEQFCHRLSSDDEEEEEHVYDVRKAHQRLVQVSEENTVLEVRRSKREVSESDDVFGL